MGGIIWLASYPKSGNTWVRAFLHNLLKNPSAPVPLNELNQFSLGDASYAWYARYTTTTPDQITQAELAQIRPKVHRDLAASSRDSVFVKTHQILGENAGAPLITMEYTAAAVYVVRNPLDVVLSFADHFGCSIDDAIDDMGLEGAITGAKDRNVPEFIDSWSTNVRSWTGQPHPKIHVMRYEDMLNTPNKTFGKLTKFLGLKVSEDRLKRAIRFSDFRTLRQLEDKHGFAEKSHHGTRFFRSGKSGQWRDHLTDDQVARLVRDHATQMARFGYLTPKLRNLADLTE